MVKFRHKGNYSKATRYFKQLKKAIKVDVLDKYGKSGVAALSSATPVDSGLTASSWNYRIERSSGSAKIVFTNAHIEQGVPIAIILQYGHGTGTGGWVEGRDYINPAAQSIFDHMADEAWREVTGI